MSIFITDEQEEEVMEDRYKIEVGDIIQVTDETCTSSFYSYGDIGRVQSIDKVGSIWVDLSLSRNHRKGSPTGVGVWNISKQFITKINVVKEGV